MTMLNDSSVGGKRKMLLHLLSGYGCGAGQAMHGTAKGCENTDYRGKGFAGQESQGTNKQEQGMWR